MLDGFSISRLIQFTTDDVCTARLYIRPQNSTQEYSVINSAYETKNHTFKLNQPEFYGEYEFWIEVTNKSGLINTIRNTFPLKMDQEFELSKFNALNWSVPSGYMLNKAVDLDQDGKKEIVISRYNENFAFGPIEIYEFNMGEFNLVYKTAFTAIPRDAGDSDNDGKSELLLGFGQYSFILESLSEDSYPTELIWEDSTGFWAAAFTDLDMDGNIEICGRREQSYFLKENISDNTYQQIAELQNNSSGSNRLGIPRITEADLNLDGKNELIYGDSDGDILVYNAGSDNSFQTVASAKTTFPDATEMISVSSSGDLFLGTHTFDNINYEHEFDARYWTVERFGFENMDLVLTDSLNFFGYFPTKDFDSGITASIINEQQYLFISFFPRLYLLKADQDSLTPVWSYSDVRSNTVLVNDFDNDGFDEFYFNNGKEIIGFSSGEIDRPAEPVLRAVYPKDTTQVELEWYGKGSSFNVYRGQNFTQLIYLGNSSDKSFSDSTVKFNSKYYYAITAVDSSFQIKESFFSNIDSVYISLPPRIDSVSVENKNQLIIYMNQPVKIKNDFPVTAFFTQTENNLSSAVANSYKSILLTFTNKFPENSSDSLHLGNIFNTFDMPLERKSAKRNITFIAEQNVPYVQQADWLDNKKLNITFNISMDVNSLTDKNNYEISPDGSIDQIIISDSLNKSIEIKFSRQTLTGGTGQYSYLKLKNIKSSNGVSISDNTTVSLIRTLSNLDNVIIYPQPAKIDDNFVYISGLPEKSEIFIFNLNGNLINKYFNSVELGAFKWDFTDLNKQKVHSGIYIVHVIHEKQKKQYKLMVVR